MSYIYNECTESSTNVLKNVATEKLLALERRFLGGTTRMEPIQKDSPIPLAVKVVSFEDENGKASSRERAVARSSLIAARNALRKQKADEETAAAEKAKFMKMKEMQELDEQWQEMEVAWSEQERVYNQRLKDRPKKIKKPEHIFSDDSDFEDE